MTDVQKTNNEQPKQRQLTSREEAMEAVARTRNAEFEKETGVHIEMPVVTGLDPDADEGEAEAERERARLNNLASGNGGDDDQQARLQQEQEEATARSQQAAQDTAAQEAAQATARAQAQAGIDPKGKYTFKVNGQDTELTGEEVLRRVQKDVSADVRLEQASQSLRDAERIRREAEEQQASLQQSQQATARKGADTVVVDPDVTKEFTRALFKGDEDAAATAFNKAVTSAVAAAQGDQKGRGQAATPVNPSEIAAQVRQQIAIDSALEQSKKDYPDLYADPDIEAVAASKIERKVKEGKPFVDALDEVQTSMATTFGWKKAAGTPASAANTNRRGEKLARKESLEQPLGGPNVKSTTQEEPVQNVSEAILEIAKARGQLSVS